MGADDKSGIRLAVVQRTLLIAMVPVTNYFSVPKIHLT